MISDKKQLKQGNNVVMPDETKVLKLKFNNFKISLFAPTNLKNQGDSFFQLLEHLHVIYPND